VVQPYFLFDGVLLKQIAAAVDRYAQTDGTTEVILVSHLRSHPLLLEAFEERAYEAVHGLPMINCDLCKYRVRLIGCEPDLGLPQGGHHYHVRASPRGDHEHTVVRHRNRETSDVLSCESSHPWDGRLLERLQLMS
jgi:hypothetical protein